MFDIADYAFSGVPDEEKRNYLADIKDGGSYQGYKLREFWVMRRDPTHVSNAYKTLPTGY